MLVTEERGAAGGYSGNLLLLAGAPRDWLRDGQRIRIENLPTQFGPLSLDVHSATHQGRIEARITPPHRTGCDTIKLRFPHPDGCGLQSVRLNGKLWDDFDRNGEWIRFPATTEPSYVDVMYEGRPTAD